LAQAHRSILLTRQRQATERSVLVTFDDTDLSWRALRQAAALAHPDYPLIILLLTPSLPEAEMWQAQIEAWLHERGRRANYRQLTQVTMPRLLKTVGAEHCDLLIIGSERLPVASETAVSLLDQLDCSLMIVR
jgi:nucleotide-binding universal stress UspA family protein